MRNLDSPSAWHRLELVLARLRPYREPLSLAVDALAIALAWNATYLFRLGFERWWNLRPDYDPWVMLGVVAIYLVVFALAGVPTGLWRFSGFGEIRRLALACVVAGTMSAAVVMGAGLVRVPRAVLAVHPFFALIAVCLVRLGYRMLYEHARARITGGTEAVKRAVVMGAGDAARLLIAGLHGRGWIVSGLLDDDPALRGTRIGDTRVLGTLDDAGDADLLRGCTHVIIAMPEATPSQRRRALRLAAGAGLPVLTSGSVEDMQGGRPVAERLRDIEPADLLGREPVALDEVAVARLIEGRSVMVTGAGGSIGAELCRQIAGYAPARLVLYEMSELNLYSIEQELAEAFPGIALLRLIGDVKSLAHLRHTLAEQRPQLLLHAAAYKHVPLMEEHNAWAALANNTLGTYHAALAAAEAGVERFVLISTDKAVNPTSVMGASKRAAEMAVSALAAEHPATRFMAVRFGNVLGSSGSVIPKFKEQIARGGPVTVTHPDIIRYFMTIPEAARLVLQAAAIGDSGQVYVLDMGEPVAIVDLARELIRLAGHRDGAIDIEFSGLRSGEKLYEELLSDADTTLPTTHQRLRLARLQGGGEAGVMELLAWAASLPTADAAAVRARLARVVREYQPAPGAAGAA